MKELWEMQLTQRRQDAKLETANPLRPLLLGVRLSF
jgi:hypothetical protein